MFRPHFNIDFFGGEGKWGSILSDRGLEGSILKLDIQRAFFLHFCPRLKVGAVMRALPSHRCGLGLNIWDYAIPRLVLCSSQRKYFPIPIRWAISNQERVCRGCTTTKSVCLLVYLFNPYFLPSGPSFHPYVRSTFVPPSTYSLRGYSMLPWIVGAFHSPKICLKFWKFHVTVSGTVPNVWFAPNTTREPK